MENIYKNEEFESAISFFSSDIITFLQTLMIGGGFEEIDRSESCRAYFSFMLLVLKRISIRIDNIANDQPIKDMSEEKKLQQKIKKEKISVELMERQEYNFSISIGLFDLNYPKSLLYLMSQNGFDDEECTETSYSFFTFFLGCFRTLCDIYFTKKAEFLAKEEMCLVEDIKENSEDNMLICEEVLNSSSSYEIIAETYKHLFYYVSKGKNSFTLKVPKALEQKSMIQELNVSRKIKHPAIRKSFTIATFKKQEALVLDWALGVPLSSVTKLSIEDFFQVAREIVSCIVELHENELFHGRLSDDHFIYDKNLKTIKVIGFRLSKNLRNETQLNSNYNNQDRNLHFISPEQTCKVQCVADFRSDFYSIGILMYKLLTGKYPFQDKSVYKLLCLHIYHNPERVSTIENMVPSPVCAMVSKLISKEPDKRYQSGKGILYDLDWMISEYCIDQSLSSVKLAQHDASSSLILSQKLYGRNEEYNCLLSVFQELSCTCMKIVQVCGKAGSGKSALVFELQKEVLKRNGLFISGKYDSQKCIPYAAIQSAINNLCETILLFDKVALANYKSKIMNAVGEEGIILIDFFPCLSQIIGYQPKVLDSFGVEAMNRLNYVFLRFMKAICSFSSPVVLVLEDIQWIDHKSVDLILLLMKEKSLSNFMIICTYREEEIRSDHIVIPILEEMKSLSNTCIKLGDLNKDILNDMISDTLLKSPFETYSLTSYIFKKTEGNCFYVQQMLKVLYAQGDIFFCDETKSWNWDLSKLCESEKTENVIDFLRQRIKSLDELTKETLVTASCLGTPFPLQFLKVIVNSSKGIQGAIRSGMIRPLNNSNDMYCFIHDNMQEAAYSLFAQYNASKIFWYIAIKLWKHLREKDIADNMYTLANLFVRAKDSLDRKEDVREIANFLLQVGKSAMSSIAYKEASKFFHVGIMFLGDNCWESYELCLSLYDEAAKAAFCNRNYEEMKELSNVLATKAKSKEHLVNSYLLEIKLHYITGRHVKGIQVASIILNELGEDINVNLDKNILKTKMKSTIIFLNEKTDKEILSLQELQDKRYFAIIRIFYEIIIGSQFISPDTCAYFSLRMVQITLEYGISLYSCIGMCLMGSYLCSNGDKLGHRMGKLSLDLLSRLKKDGAKAFTPQVYSFFYVLIHPFFGNICDTVEPLYLSYKISLEVGKNIFALQGAIGYSRYAFFSGKCLASLLRELDDQREMLHIKAPAFLSIHQAVKNLQDNETDHPEILEGEIFGYELAAAQNFKPFDAVRIFIVRLIISYFFNDYVSSVKHANSIRPMLPMLQNSFHFTLFLFYESLALLANARSIVEGDDVLNQCRKNLQILGQLSRNGPENILNKYYLVEAEIARRLNNNTEAERLYIKAALIAQECHFPHEEALALELLGLFFLEKDQKSKAAAHLLASHKKYQYWGATAKMRHLEVKHNLSIQQDIESTQQIVNEDFSFGSQSCISSLSFSSHGVALDRSNSPMATKRIKFCDS